MDLQVFVRLAVLLTVLQIKNNIGQLIKPEALAKFGETCKKIAQDPYFDHEAVIGKPWRIYYTWGMKSDNGCIELAFKNTTSWITDRFWNDMSEYLEDQPYWAAASLHMSIVATRRELLLFSNQGSAGSFDAVPNVIRDGNMAPRRGSVPLMKYQMKLIKNNKYLIISDCHVGLVSLLVRAGHSTHKEVASIASDLKFGEGYLACINDENNNP